MAKTQYLTFYIVLTDAEAVAANQVLYPAGVNRAPYDAGPPAGGAAIEFSAPFRGNVEPAAGEAPFIWTPWREDDTSDKPFPIDVATFTRHTGGFLGIGGTTIKYYWIGQFVYASPTVPTVGGVPVVAQALIAQRRFCEGFEVGGGGPAGLSAAQIGLSRDASRHVGGLGLAIRSTTASIVVQLITSNLPGYVGFGKSWERLYVRLRALPGGSTMFWGCGAFSPSDEGLRLYITATGQIAIFNFASNVATLLTTSATLVVDVWTRLDLLVEYNSAPAYPAGAGQFRLCVNGALVTTVAVPAASQGLGANAAIHTYCYLGNKAATANTLELDIDDWSNSEFPTLDGTRTGLESLTGLDWLNGSKIALVRPAAYSSNHDAVAWTGAFQILLQQFAYEGSQTGVQTVTSSTSAALAAVATDAALVVDADPHSLGAVAMAVSMVGGDASGGGTTAMLGYSVAGAAAVMQAITQSNQRFWQFMMFRPAALLTPSPITPIELRFTKTTNVNPHTIVGMCAQVEMIGTFGAEDIRATETDGEPVGVPVFVGHHNAPYPRTPWALGGLAAPAGAYIVVGGTYVGNGTATEIPFRTPVHWFWLRPISTAHTVFWSSTMVAGHDQFMLGVQSHTMVQALEDPAFAAVAGVDAQQQQFLLRVGGSGAAENALGVTYQYIAVCDPAARYLLNGQCARNGASGTAVARLANLEFLAEFGFIEIGSPSQTTTPSTWFRTPDHAAGTLQRVGGAQLAAAAVFGVGSLTTQAALHAVGASGGQINYCLWRRADGNNAPGQAAVVTFGSYTGDGAASRTISIAPATGKRPIFALVNQTNGAGSFRDPSHTGTTSSEPQTGAAQASGFIQGGGIDAFSVGASLNGAGTIFYYFVLWASSAAGNGGWGINGEFIHVEADSPIDGPWPDPVEPTDPVDPEPEPEPNPADLETDLSAVCKPYTTKVVNLALSYLGVTQQVVELGTEQSREAMSARLHYTSDVDEVLRAWTWAFARRYASTLTLVAGTATVPANDDWQYAYRVPNNCLFARRIVDPALKRKVGPAIPFDRGADDAGELIYTDRADPTLEYTARVPCPASARDPIFVKALAYRLASSLAQPLGRDVKLADTMLRNYKLQLGDAELRSAQEKQEQDTGTGDADWISGR
jgi:hypothetical protein